MRQSGVFSNTELSEHPPSDLTCLIPAQKKFSLKASVTSVLLFVHLGEQEAPVPQFKADSGGFSLPGLNH